MWSQKICATGDGGVVRYSDILQRKDKKKKIIRGKRYVVTKNLCHRRWRSGTPIFCGVKIKKKIIRGKRDVVTKKICESNFCDMNIAS